MNDLLTMIWKETKDSVLSGGRNELVRPLIFILLLGVFIPWQLGARWLDLSGTPIAVFIACYLPFFFIASYIGDAIAGERERHTLETLLASRISDQAILWGKIIVTVAYALGMTFLGLLVGFIVSNLTAKSGGWTFYHPLKYLGETVILSLLVGLLAASGGSLISLRAPTVRQAQQTMMVGSISLFLVLFLSLRYLPASFVQSLDLFHLLLYIMGALLVFDLILLSILASNFKRSRLILS